MSSATLGQFLGEYLLWAAQGEHAPDPGLFSHSMGLCGNLRQWARARTTNHSYLKLREELNIKLHQWIKVHNPTGCITYPFGDELQYHIEQEHGLMTNNAQRMAFVRQCRSTAYVLGGAPKLGVICRLKQWLKELPERWTTK